MCNAIYQTGFFIVKLYTFTNIIILIFSIIHYVVAFKPITYIADKREFMSNFEGDIAINFINAANRYLIVFLFNLMNSIILWRQYLIGGIRERVIFEAVCISVSYLDLVIESLFLLVEPGSLVSSVIPLLILSILLLLFGLYYTVVIIYTSDKVEEIFINSLKKVVNDVIAQNIEININNNPRPPEEEKQQNQAIELKEEKGGKNYEIVGEN
jgi:hypothetical protein